MAEGFFLASLLKASERYQNPLFWAVLYTLFLVSSDYMFRMAVGDWKIPLLLSGLNFGLSYALFAFLKEAGDGLPYWIGFCVGFMGLVFFMP
jgi:hypothetical protein